MIQFLSSRALRRGLSIGCLLGIVGVGLWMVGVYALADYHARAARKALERQRYEDALKEFETALRFRSRSAELHLLAGRTARQMGNFPLAWEHLHRVRELQNGVTADLQLEEYLLRAQTGQLEDVFPYLVPHLHREDDRTVLVLETLSHGYLFLYRFDNAWQCLQRWLQLQPDNVAALFLRGKYFTLTMKPEEAVADLQRVLELDSRRIPARILLAQTLRQSHRTDEAAKEFEAALRQSPENLEARLGLAACCVDNSEWSKAESIIREVSADDENDAELLYLRGRIAEAQGRYAEAVSHLRAAVAARPSDNTSCYFLIRCYQRLGDEASASKYQDLLKRIEKDQLRLLALTNKEKDALATNPALCCELGELCLRLGIKRRGVHWLQAALYLDPNYWPAHERLLHYYESLGPNGEEEASFHRRQLANRPTGK